MLTFDVLLNVHCIYYQNISRHVPIRNVISVMFLQPCPLVTAYFEIISDYIECIASIPRKFMSYIYTRPGNDVIDSCFFTYMIN
jgi:hypothetical protein